MLYVFQVDTGRMLTLEMSLALESVAYLKSSIATKFGIAEDKQVLLISGGEYLMPDSRVCSYNAAGTDTSPIFLFNKAAIESPNPPQAYLHYESDVDVTDRVDAALDMPPSYQTLVIRAELAKQLYEMANQQRNDCEKLINEQHLQHQGWQSVVANIGDLVKKFQNNFEQLQSSYGQYLENKENYRQLLEDFKQDVEILERIPILPALNSNNEESISLLDWINQNDPENSIQVLAEKCAAALDKFTEDSLNELVREANEVFGFTNNQQMTVIKGLEERLYGLDQIHTEAKKAVNSSNELSRYICQNQQRAGDLRDQSIFPDLCRSHKAPLQGLLKNHNSLRDARRRCAQAKSELSSSIYQRLKWVMYAQHKLTSSEHKLFIYNETLRRLKQHLSIIKQVHIAPRMYLSAVAEVVRRKNFSGAFLPWAQKLAQFSSNVYHEEKQSREGFTASVNAHFIKGLFPGLNDFPPPYAIECPAAFDLNLPALSPEDLSFLQRNLPEELGNVLLLPQNDLFSSCSCKLRDSSSDRDASMIDQDQSVHDKLMADLEEHVKTRDVQQQRIAHLEEQVIVKNTLDARIKELEEQLSAKESHLVKLEAELESKKDLDNRIMQLESELSQKSNLYQEQANRIRELEEMNSQNQMIYQEKVQKLEEEVKVINEQAQLVQGLEEKVKELNLKEQRIGELEQQLQNHTETESERIRELEAQNKISCSQAVKQIEELEDQLRSRNDLVLQLQQQIAIRPTPSNSIEKVAVLSCEIGDIVLLCFTERYNSYVVFSLNSVLHFLHSDSLEALGLRQSPGEQQTAPRTWALAVCTDKEYCQARKPNNRYRVAVNTRFYRIKAKPWNNPLVEARRNISASMVASPTSSTAGEAMSTSDIDQAIDAGATMSNSCFPQAGAK